MNFSNAEPGDIITFGSYAHTTAGNDRTPIQWRVLENTGATLFLLSEYIIDSKRYHNQPTETTWRDCDLRRWLNTTFLEAAFRPDELARIAVTLCGDNGADSPDTRDRVFLLSAAEVRAHTDPQDSDRRRRTIATDYARARKPDGCHVYVYDKSVEADYLFVDSEKHGCSWWWTRTQLQMQNGRSARAAFVGARSNIKSYGKVDIARYGVRPALKLKP